MLITAVAITLLMVAGAFYHPCITFFLSIMLGGLSYYAMAKPEKEMPFLGEVSFVLCIVIAFLCMAICLPSPY